MTDTIRTADLLRAVGKAIGESLVTGEAYAIVTFPMAADTPVVAKVADLKAPLVYTLRTHGLRASLTPDGAVCVVNTLPVPETN